MSPTFLVFRSIAVAVVISGFVICTAGCSRGTEKAAPSGPGAEAIPPPPGSPAPSAQISRDKEGRALGLPGAESQIPRWAGQTRDEPFAVREFLESRAAPPNNIAMLYCEALADLSADMGFFYTPAQWKKRLPRVQALSRQINNVYQRATENQASVSIAELDATLQQAAAVIKKIDEAQAKGECVFVTGLRIDTILPHAQAARAVARLTYLQLLSARKHQDVAGAVAALRRCLRLSRDLRPRGVMVVQLVSIAMDAVVLDGLRRFTLPVPTLKPEGCDQVIDTLQEHDRQGLDWAHEGICMEYVLARNTLYDLQRGRLTLAAMSELLGPVQMSTRLKSLEGKKIDWVGEVAECNKLFAEALRNAGRSYNEAPEKSSASDLYAQFSSAQAKSVASLLCPDVDMFSEAVLRGRARLAGAKALVALRRYQLIHHQFPPDLALAASEAGLQKVPQDPYSSRPLRYRLVKGRPIVYSVGADLSDDGGVQRPPESLMTGDIVFELPQ